MKLNFIFVVFCAILLHAVIAESPTTNFTGWGGQPALKEERHEVIEGDNLRLNCDSSKWDPGPIEWRFAIPYEDEYNLINNATNKTLSLRFMLRKQSGKYICISKKDNVILNKHLVLVKVPQFSYKILNNSHSDLKIDEGKDFLYELGLLAFPPPKFRLFNDSNKNILMKKYRMKGFNLTYDGKMLRIFIKNITRKYFGRYKLTITSRRNFKELRFLIYVRYPPDIIFASEGYEQPTWGMAVLVKCRVYGYPKPDTRLYYTYNLNNSRDGPSVHEITHLDDDDPGIDTALYTRYCRATRDILFMAVATNDLGIKNVTWIVKYDPTKDKRRPDLNYPDIYDVDY